MKTILALVGTRPEAIKMAPLVLEARRRRRFRVVLCSSGQHEEMLRDGLEPFDLTPDIDLRVMGYNQGLPALTSRLLTALSDCFSAVKPDAVLVQGDTQTCVCGAQAAFWQGIPVGHVEAGLRSKSRWNPFPEEMNRILAAALSEWHFAPTKGARANLIREGISDEKIIVTGNTGIDALFLACRSLEARSPRYIAFDPKLLELHELVLVTGHRRENHGPNLQELCKALRDVVEARVSACVVFPVHLNPNVRKVVSAILSGVKRVWLIPPQPYLAFVDLMRRSRIIVTDSGGIQEEAPSVGKPVLVTRTNTERPEVLSTGLVELVGNSRHTIRDGILRLLRNGSCFHPVENPCGDGHAAERINDFLEAQLIDRAIPHGWDEVEFQLNPHRSASIRR